VSGALTDAQLRELYADAHTIAVVGCSSHWPKPSCVVPAYMQAQGYRIVPVNPHEPEVLGQACVGVLRDIEEPIDVVDVFRPAEEAPEIAREAAQLGARCLWLQTGITSSEAEQIACDAGMLFVSDACIGITHGNLGLGEGVKAYRERLSGAMSHRDPS
jgi:predicted CoA-binding protein